MYLCIHKCARYSRPLLRVNCRLVYYALQIMHYLNGGGGEPEDCIKINLTESICLIAN